jgi:hypothetical protein
MKRPNARNQLSLGSHVRKARETWIGFRMFFCRVLRISNLPPSAQELLFRFFDPPTAAA